MRIKKNDTITVLSGKDKGKTGKVVRVDAERETVVVDGINLHTKFVSPRRAGEKGQQMKIPAHLHWGKVMLMCPHCGKATRVGTHRVQADKGERKERMCKKCQHSIA